MSNFIKLTAPSTVEKGFHDIYLVSDDICHIEHYTGLTTISKFDEKLMQRVPTGQFNNVVDGSMIMKYNSPSVWIVQESPKEVMELIYESQKKTD